MKHFLLIFSLFLSYGFCQEIQGKVIDETGEPLIGALVETSEGVKTRTDFDGFFVVQIQNFPVTIVISYIDYKNAEKTFQKPPEDVTLIEMTPATQALEEVVISASRREQKIQEIPVSLEIIKPELIENKGLVDVEQAVNQAPGAYAMDGQISIRGGSGFSYGAGSRVLVVWNDAPLLSADAGDAKWESIPLENIGQIEVLKGASSVLYGSGALNGIISIRDKEPTKEGLTKFSYQAGIFDQPKREGLQWSDRTLVSRQFTAFYGKMFDRFGFTVSAYDFKTDGYRSGEEQERVRLNGSFIFKPKILPRLKSGLNYSINMERKGLFIIWASDSLGYQPSGGTVDPYSDSSSLSRMNGLRVMIDPYIKYYDKYGNKHDLQTRWYHTLNESVQGEGQSAKAYMYYADYKFERKFKNELVVISGITSVFNQVRSELYGDHESRNYSIYSQVEKDFGKLNLTAGVRGEYFQQNELEPDSYTYLNRDSTKSIPIRPIFRAGVNYELLEFTHIRGSVGQAFRYPSVAERFASTSVGALNIFPNNDLEPEKGWSAEIGLKQGFRIKNFKGFIDVAGFINEYDNMMEFTFGYFKPDSIPISFNPNNPGYPGKWFGFRAENAEKARITGFEFSLNGKGNIGPVEITTIMGYTYMNPIYLNTDSVYIYGENDNGGLSDTSSNMLKYRFRHLAKGDIQFDYKKVMIGFSARYNSFMENIDGTFENGVNVPFSGNTQILPGLKEYREKNNTGDLVFDSRLGYRINENFMINGIINNVFNREYMTRPGDIQAPRQFILQIQIKF
ncbi:MAG: TonB-dependent receptor [Brumimicrobium sp.]|nr:TonB-dependent receptor [Brumimicrobium sp.]